MRLTIGDSFVSIEMERGSPGSPRLDSKRSAFKLCDLGLKISGFSLLLYCQLKNQGARPVDLLGSLHFSILMIITAHHYHLKKIKNNPGNAPSENGICLIQATDLICLFNKKLLKLYNETR